MKKIKDQKVHRRTYEEIGELVTKARDRWRISLRHQIYMTAVFDALKGEEFGSSGRLDIEFHANENLEPCVKFSPLRLCVSKGTWTRASLGASLDNFKLAHELGHILLHKYHVLNFSNGREAQLTFIPNEESAEWQANAFAAQFLTPNELALNCGTRQALVEEFNYPPEFAEERLQYILEYKRRRYASGACSKCGSLCLEKFGSEFYCQNCDPLVSHL